MFPSATAAPAPRCHALSPGLAVSSTIHVSRKTNTKSSEAEKFISSAWDKRDSKEPLRFLRCPCKIKTDKEEAAVNNAVAVHYTAYRVHIHCLVLFKETQPCLHH